MSKSRVLVQPINLIYTFLQEKRRVEIWLYEQKNVRISGVIVGFDEFMNLVLDGGEEIDLKKKTRKPLGRLMLKGDTITLISPAEA